MSYQSPIEIIYGEVQTKLEGDVLKVIQGYDITVDKNELLKALNYDRDQYHKGWSDGYVQANADIVRCKDCKWYDALDNTREWECTVGLLDCTRNDFCSRGERRKDADSDTCNNDI